MSRISDLIALESRAAEEHGLVEFLLARIAEDEAPTFELVPYHCPADCCAPSGWVGHRCLICDVTDYGGTVEAITEIATQHAEKMHQRSRALRECEAHRRIVTLYVDMRARDLTDAGSGYWAEARDVIGEALRALALPYADHPDYRQEWKP